MNGDDYPSALAQAAHQAYAAADLPGAEACLRFALGHARIDAHALYFLGHLGFLQGRLDEAAWLLERALDLQPDHARAHNDLGETLRLLGRTGAALAHLQQAARLEPGLAHAHGNLAIMLLAAGRDDDALAQAHLSVAQSTDAATARTDLASVLGRLGRPREALEHYRAADALRPADPRARYFASLMRLTLGEMPAAWDDHELRRILPSGIDGRIDPPGTRWNGEAVAPGTNILLHSEQGFGDTIQFARYVPWVAARGGRVVLDVPPALARLMQSLPGGAMVRPRGEPVESCALHCPLMSLPQVFATTEATIPADIPYLAAPPAERARWRERLPRTGRPLVGLAWSGRVTHAADGERSIPLSRLSGLLDAADVGWIGLQHDVRAADAAVLAGLPSLANLGAEATDFADTAALLSALDLVVSVDTSIVHLAGALGLQAWVMLPFAADWRWMRDRSDSPWYPTLRLFRQPARHDWDAVIDAVGAALRTWVEAGSWR